MEPSELAVMRDDGIGIMNKRPTLCDPAAVAERVITKIMEYVETFIDGVY